MPQGPHLQGGGEMSDNGITFSMGVISGVAVTAICAVIIYNGFKTDAVEAGAAHWLVEPNGRTTFEWGPSKKGTE